MDSVLWSRPSSAVGTSLPTDGLVPVSNGAKIPDNSGVNDLLKNGRLMQENLVSIPAVNRESNPLD